MNTKARKRLSLVKRKRPSPTADEPDEDAGYSRVEEKLDKV